MMTLKPLFVTNINGALYEQLQVVFIVSFFFYKTTLMNIMMLSLSGECNGNFQFLVHLLSVVLFAVVEKKSMYNFYNQNEGTSFGGPKKNKIK